MQQLRKVEYVEKRDNGLFLEHKPELYFQPDLEGNRTTVPRGQAPPWGKR